MIDIRNDFYVLEDNTTLRGKHHKTTLHNRYTFRFLCLKAIGLVEMP